MQTLKSPRACLSLLLSLPFVVSAHGAEFTNSAECVAGKRVKHRNGSVGVVTELRNGSCVVRLDDGSQRHYLHWMLSPAGDARATATAGLSRGQYVCSADGAGTFRISIRDGRSYTDRAGKSGNFNLKADDDIVFVSGSLAGQYSRLLGPNKFGLSAAKGKMFYTVCNLK